MPGKLCRQAASIPDRAQQTDKDYGLVYQQRRQDVYAARALIAANQAELSVRTMQNPQGLNHRFLRLAGQTYLPASESQRRADCTNPRDIYRQC